VNFLNVQTYQVLKTWQV